MNSLPQLWTPSQRKTLLCACAILLVFLAIEWLRKPANISDPPPSESPRAAEIQDRLDPNTADAAALSAIPNLGEIKAAEIVEYREAFTRQHPGKCAFRSVDDLRHIKGIGPATTAMLENYLSFPKK